MTLGDIIFQYRSEHGLSQRQFAMKCGISNGYIAMIEKNENPQTGKKITVSLDKVKAIAGAMGMTADELIRMADGGTPVSIGAGNDLEESTYIQVHHPETRILAKGFDQLPEAERKRAIDMAKLIFAAYADAFEDRKDDDDAT